MFTSRVYLWWQVDALHVGGEVQHKQERQMTHRAEVYMEGGGRDRDAGQQEMQLPVCTTTSSIVCTNKWCMCKRK